MLVGPVGLTERANTFDERGGVARVRGGRGAGRPGRNGARRRADGSPAATDVLATVRGTLTSAELVGLRAALIELATGRAGRGVAQLARPTVAERAIVTQSTGR